MKPSIIITLSLLFFSCSYNITDNQEQSYIDPQIIFIETASHYWYRDSNLDSLIIPPENNIPDTSGNETVE